MKYLIAILTLALLPALAAFTGCASGTNDLGAVNKPVVDKAAAQRAVLSVEGKYRLALIVADKYVNLPLCDKASPPCATLTVVRVVQKVQPAVRAILDASEQTVRTDGFGDNVYSSAADAALAGLAQFEAITATLK